ncbi:MAG: prepilin-type N-terminal cleavage/methylation domain-containing protein [Myxococcota bacterium]
MSFQQKVRKHNAGFTLTELMIIVLILGILTITAVPIFNRFMKKSRTGEAPVNISSIIRGAIIWYQESHTDSLGNPIKRHFPNTLSPFGVQNSELVRAPSNAPCSDGRSQYTRDSRPWTQQPWKSLRFGLDKSHYFQYVYDVNNNDPFGPVLTVSARADLDCDAQFSTFKNTIRFTAAGEPETSGLIAIDPLE